MSCTWEKHICPWCGGYHIGVCPHVRAIEYHPNGEVKRVELWRNEFAWVSEHRPTQQEEIGECGTFTLEEGANTADTCRLTTEGQWSPTRS